MKKPLVLDIHTFDPALTSGDAAGQVLRMVEDSWAKGADLVLLPEFTWMAEVPLEGVPKEAELAFVSECFWQKRLPEIQARLLRADKGVVLGTVPCVLPGGDVRNRAPVLLDGRFLHQDKLHLTPWESGFQPGETLRVFDFLGWRLAVIICLDMEIPELSARLRGCGVDLILCPSATETVLGVERVNRCASARAVELGCYVAVAHLTGTAYSDLIDVSVGCAALYRPSQAAFAEAVREERTEVVSAGCRTLRVSLDPHALALMRRMRVETNPAHFGKDYAGMEREIRIESASSD